MANLQTIGPNVLAGPLNNNFAALNSAKMEKTADSDLNMNNRSITDIAAIDFGNWQTVTIDGSNAITVTKTHVRVDTSGGPGELHTINGGTRGQFIFLRCVNNARPVTIKHMTGNILINDNMDIVLNNGTQIYLLLNLDGSTWCVVGNVGVRRDGDTMTGILSIKRGYPSLVLEDTNVDGVFAALTGYSGRLSIRLGGNASANEVLGVMTDGLLFPPNGRRIVIGTGSPQGVVTAPAGSIYLNTSGGASTTIWVKESGTGNTGWVAK